MKLQLSGFNLDIISLINSSWFELGGRPEILTTYDGVIDAVNNHSLKYQVTSLQMPPYGSNALSDSEINIIKNWIDCE